MPTALTGWLRSAAFAATAVAALVACADVFFFRHTPGFTVGVFTAALLALLCLRAGKMRVPARVLAVGVAGMALAAVEEPGDWVVLLSMLGLIALALTIRGGWNPSPSVWFVRMLGFVPMTIAVLPHDIALFVRRKTGRDPNAPFRLVWLTKWALPLSISAVFVALFWFANPIIEQTVDSIASIAREVIDFFIGGVSFTRLLFWLVSAMAIWALLRARANKPLAHTAPVVDPQNIDLTNLLTPETVVRCLALFNAVFLVQTLLDARYLWGGAALPTGMTLAQYAHRGAYPLIATALLAAACVLIAFRPGGAAEHSPVARKLVYLWLVQNVFLVTSAAWRLVLYVDAYGLSQWRVAAMLWMLLVGIGLASIIWRIVRSRSNAWLLHVNTLSALLMVYACAPLNIDGFIASFNTQHCRESGGGGAPIDCDYLESLGPESLPAIDWLAGHLRPDADPQLTPRLAKARSHLTDMLASQLHEWQGWTLRRSRLAVGAAQMHGGKNPSALRHPPL